jgi:hypothetical protein
MPKQRTLTPAEKREEMYNRIRATLKKVRRGEEVEMRDLQLTKKSYVAFMELFDVFKPSIKSTLLAQQAEIESLIEQYEETDEDEDEDEDD